MTIQFKTFSGSTYEVDQENKKIRRLTGTVNPTARQGQDGDWKEYDRITPIEVGNSVVIGWKLIVDNQLPIWQTTMTSVVTEVVNYNNQEIFS